MCVVSMVGDFYRDRLPRDYPWWGTSTGPSQSEFDRLKKQVEEMKELLERAKIYDAANGQPNCEMDDKMDMLRKIASAVGISLDDVLGARPSPKDGGSSAPPAVVPVPASPAST